MPGNAALLIDLENFYIGREQNHARSHESDTYEFPVDLDSLCSFARSIAGERRLIVQRAYANFNDRRPGVGEKRWDYYLQPQPRYLMEQGLEPVQVFRFPGGNNKNAADMKMAMDATVLLQAPSSVELFIIVTGDSDFIPLVLELKRSGAEVYVIGVSHCTKPIFERYCDRFEYFEDLLAARELKREDATDLDVVRKALAVLVSRMAPIKFAAVKPLLSDELGFRFDPTRHGCESTGDFLRKNAASLGVQVKRGDHDWEIIGLHDGISPAVIPGDPSATDYETNAEAVAPRSDPSDHDEGLDDQDDDAHGDDSDPPSRAPRRAKPVPRARAPHESTPIDAPNAAGAQDVHTAALYRDLLRQGMPRCYVIEYDDWNTIVDTVYSIVAPAEDPVDGRSSRDGEKPVRIVHQDLLTEVTEQCIDQGMVDASRKVRDVCFQLFKSGCFHCAEDGAEPGQQDFHWSKKAMLDRSLASVDEMVERAWSFLADLLARRLDQRGSAAKVQVEAFRELVAGGDPTDEDVVLIDKILKKPRAN